MMTVSVHVSEKTSARVNEYSDFITVHVECDGDTIDIFMPMSRIDDARRIARALDNTTEGTNNE